MIRSEENSLIYFHCDHRKKTFNAAPSMTANRLKFLIAI